ncbi:hypothetical protein B0H11DRAFT_2345645 [Mycena galericulata]|nr:hypothetical protein B0H11DRAFT_2345645 [Mycena galericulata]
MATQSADNPALTRAQKRQNTIAEREENARQEQKAFEAEAKKTGGRQAKVVAKINAVWNVDNPKSRKRTSSTAQAPDNVKKARESVAQSDAEDDLVVSESEEAQAKGSKTKRKYPAPVIAINTDSDSEAPSTKSNKFPRLDLTKLPTTAKSKAAVSKVKQVAKKALKTLVAPVKSAKGRGAAAKPKVTSKPAAAKIVAESASEVEATTSEEDGSDGNVSGSDDLADFEDANEEEFVAEVPRVLKKASASSTKSGSKSASDIEMSDATGLLDSDQESFEIDKLPPGRSSKGKQRKIQSDSEDEMADAPPQRTVHDEDIAMHEAIANSLASVPLVPRSRKSSAASSASWSSGQQVHVPDTDFDEDDDNEEAERASKKKPRKVSAARQKQADLEKPHVRAVAQPKSDHQVKVEKLTTFAATGASTGATEASHHPSARIVPPAPGKKDILLNSQTEELQRVLRSAISLVKTGLIFEDSYPPILSRAGFARAYLVSAADGIPEAKHIRERLGTDLKYAAILADILLDRINILRGDTKRTATNVVPGFFQIAGLSEVKTKELIEKVLKDHRYIFPTDPQTNQQQRLMTEKPFHHPALRAVIKDGIFTHNFKSNNMHLFISTSKKHPKQLELPDAMVALAATAVYAALLEYRTTGERQTIAFTEGAYEDTYRNHMKTLSDTRDAAPIALHKVLHTLYNDVTDGKSSVPEAGSSATLINLVDVPESD